MKNINELISIGFTESQITRIMHALEKPEGIIAVTSSAGQGQSKTFQVLADIAKSISPRTIVNDDIFYIMELGKARYDSGVSLHALTTLGASSIAGAFIYLSNTHRKDLVADQPFCIIHQKLLPVTCKHCRIHVSKVQTASMNLENIYFRNLHGCSHCNHTGYERRMLCAEVLSMDGAMLEKFTHGGLEGFNEMRCQLRGDNMNDNDHGYSAKEIALHRMQQGLFDPMDVEEAFAFYIE